MTDPGGGVVVAADPAPPGEGARERVLDRVGGRFTVAARNGKGSDHGPVVLSEEVVEVSRPRRPRVVGQHARRGHAPSLARVWPGPQPPGRGAGRGVTSSRDEPDPQRGRRPGRRAGAAARPRLRRRRARPRRAAAVPRPRGSLPDRAAPRSGRGAPGLRLVRHRRGVGGARRPPTPTFVDVARRARRPARRGRAPSTASRAPRPSSAGSPRAAALARRARSAAQRPGPARRPSSR